MNNKEINTAYFLYLADLVGVRSGGRMGYVKLLKQLYNTDFTYKIVNDINRKNDGLRLRELYFDESGIAAPENKPCSVLEVLIALSRRLSEDVLWGNDRNNGIEKLFWIMLKNLGIYYFRGDYDKNECSEILTNWMERRIKKDGSGGIFPLRKPVSDQRILEIWAQAMHYLAEHPELEG